MWGTTLDHQLPMCFPVLTRLILTTSLWDENHYFSLFGHEETEAKGGSHLQKVTELKSGKALNTIDSRACSSSQMIWLPPSGSLPFRKQEVDTRAGDVYHMRNWSRRHNKEVWDLDSMAGWVINQTETFHLGSTVGSWKVQMKGWSLPSRGMIRGQTDARHIFQNSSNWTEGREGMERAVVIKAGKERGAWL